MAKVRNRSTTLDSSRVRAWAAKKSITDLRSFKDHFDAYLKDEKGRSSTAPDNAWKGKKIDKTRAEKIAEFLGCNLTDLTTNENRWQALTNSEMYKRQFFQLRTSDSYSLGLIESIHTTAEDLETIPVTSGFQLEIIGQEKDRILILFQSKRDFHILAPINMPEGYDYLFQTSLLLYPQEIPFYFDQSMGTGWRKITVIRSPYLDIMPISDPSFPITYTELESIAYKIQMSHTTPDRQEKLAIESREFVLI